MVVIARRQTKPERLDGEINEQGSVISRCAKHAVAILLNESKADRNFNR